ncbi:(2Fe-2S)-binding protein [Streptomyces sp. NPDC060194]|uniref:(2Fe-2S)-binding protein n=1 Tax=Streptomyces sp. NPDC060194 TaxID=3347069 RepID=UPI00366A3048
MPYPAPTASVDGAPHASSLVGTYERLLAYCPALRVSVTRPGGPGEGWVDGARWVAEPALLDRFVAAETGRIAAAHGYAARPAVAGSRALHHYLWSVFLVLSGPWYLARRVPQLRSNAVHFEMATAELAVEPSGFVCLPGDPAAGSPGVRVVADEEALRAEVRDAATRHARPLVEGLAPRLRRSERVLWGMAGDDLVSGLWYLGRMRGEEERSVREATALLPRPLAPFPGGADFRRLHSADGRTHLTRTRVGCCLYYKIRADEACGTCPRVCDRERAVRLTAPG